LDLARHGGARCGGQRAPDRGEPRTRYAARCRHRDARASNRKRVAERADDRRVAMSRRADRKTRRYVQPTRGERAINALVRLLTNLGVSVYGSRVLAVRGRKSGAWRTVPVNLLMHDSERYLVAPRGETEWVRNIRVAGGGELWLGRTREPIRVVELP